MVCAYFIAGFIVALKKYFILNSDLILIASIALFGISIILILFSNNNNKLKSAAIIVIIALLILLILSWNKKVENPYNTFVIICFTMILFAGAILLSVLNPIIFSIALSNFLVSSDISYIKSISIIDWLDLANPGWGGNTVLFYAILIISGISSVVDVANLSTT